MKTKTYLKGAGVLLLTAVLLFSATAVTANTNNQISVASPIQNSHNSGQNSRDTILYDNGITTQDLILCSQNDTTYGIVSYVADDFTLTATGTCGRVIWYGGYYNGGTYGGADQRLIFYNDASGQPGSVMYEYTFPNAQTNETSIGGYYYSYEVTLTTPLTFNAGQTYWFCVQAQQNCFPQAGTAMHKTPIQGKDAMFMCTYFGFPSWTDTTSVLGYACDSDFQLLSGQIPVTCDAGGPYSGVVGTPVSFSGSASGGTAPYTYSWAFGDSGSGTGSNPTHTYSAAGTYTVTLTVTDSTSATATDTAVATITGPTIVIGNITGGFGIKAVIKNTGTVNATGVSWKIQLTGGLILLGKNKTGTVDIAVGKTATVKDMVFGFGKTSIVVTAGTASKNATGTIILFFALGVK